MSGGEESVTDRGGEESVTDRGGEESVTGGAVADRGSTESVAEREGLVRLLCEQARSLAADLPSGLTELSLRAGDCEVSARLDPAPPLPAATAARVGEPADPTQAPLAPPAEDEAGQTAVTAPLVGTFYRAPEPGADPFVEVGDLVEEGQVVAIIEAMKLMNRIEATAPGRVAEICVEDKEMVEHGQRLLLLDTDVGQGVEAAEGGAEHA